MWEASFNLQQWIRNGRHFEGILCVYFEKYVHIFNHKDILSG